MQINLINSFPLELGVEHLVYNFDIDGISRACLQELARHRIASYTVKSTRYTLKELKDEKPFITNADIERATKYCVIPNLNSYEPEDMIVAEGILHNLEILRKTIELGVPNDYSKYTIPEAYKTSLVWSINARSLQNFLSLRTDKKALWEIQLLAKAIYEALPDNHKFLFNGCING